MFFDSHQQFFGPNRVAKQATEAERKLQDSQYDGENKGSNKDKYVALNKKQHTNMARPADPGLSGLANDTKGFCSLQGISSTKLEAAVNVIWAQPERYCKAFDATMSYLDQMVTKKSNNLQSVHIAMTGSQPTKPKLMPFIGKVECEKYSTAAWNSMSRE